MDTLKGVIEMLYGAFVGALMLAIPLALVVCVLMFGSVEVPL